jgi:hypothetical protein
MGGARTKPDATSAPSASGARTASPAQTGAGFCRKFNMSNNVNYHSMYP